MQETTGERTKKRFGIIKNMSKKMYIKGQRRKERRKKTILKLYMFQHAGTFSERVAEWQKEE